MRVLITGANGFVGPWVAAEVGVRAPSASVWAAVWGEEGRGRLAQAAPHARQVGVDLREPDGIRSLVREVRPEVVLHLAAASSVGASWRTPARALEVNAVGQVHLFEALVAEALRPVVVVASSAEVYGVPVAERPLREDDAVEPVSPYGVSKAAQELVARQYDLAHGLPTIRLRLFNHTGPGRPDAFAESSFARQIAAAEAGLQPPRMAVGNLEAVRDLSDVRDVARAWWLAAARGEPGRVYNVCSGRPVVMARVLELLLGMAALEIEVVPEPARMRPSDIPYLVGDPSRFRAVSGWEAATPLERTLEDLLAWWRQRPDGGKSG